MEQAVDYWRTPEGLTKARKYDAVVTLHAEEIATRRSPGAPIRVRSLPLIR
ncbi:Uncharacterised protein [Pantoea agglomerans]|uniref:Uncharacterized protein n=1 Tax=Enterobacter agglomerans TaxID=549 RepID=A0A379ALK1_ENTAG|nr:Uncharacterised protein [Pantoea agglomerans]